MNTPSLRLLDSSAASFFPRPIGPPRPLGEVLVDRGDVSTADVTHALKLQRRIEASLGDILIAEGRITSETLYKALSEQYGLAFVDLTKTQPDPKVAGLLAPEFCLEHGIVPWMRMGSVLLVATARPAQFDAMVALRGGSSPTLLPVLARARDIRTAQANLYGTILAWRAERRVPSDQSCRSWGTTKSARIKFCLAFTTFVAICAVLIPATGFAVLTWCAVITMLLAMMLKLAASTVHLFDQARKPPPKASTITPLRMPHVSVMVPLLRETEIASALIKRLSKLSYPRALLDVVLVLEESDSLTRATLARTDLPSWMRIIEVPTAARGLTTKPRALNYALDFCKGSIIGIWDAEDAPEPDQIEKVANRFHVADDDVVCLQGRLDYYNPRQNWLSRCFTIEYSAWWRLIMPGLAKLGFVIPLGGTTLFFRRSALEDLGGWDAHNVTEDADLGVRLARAGYRTELIDTTTFEEANCRAWPWVRQRSRWLKGFAITWAAHMRHPLHLLRDLGLYRFLGLQLFFLSALSAFLFAPVFWLLFLVPFGLLPNPFGDGLAAQTLPWIFIACEIATLGIHLAATRKPEHRHLSIWAPTMIAYFPLATIAMYKALYELVFNPFFWDKTQHGVPSHSTANANET